MARQHRGAHGEPWQMMLYRCDQYLNRLRQTKPFPVDFNEFVVTVLPVGVLSLSQQETVWANLQRAIQMGHLLHFELEGEDPSLAFWIRCSEKMPVPRDMGDIFIVDKKNLYWKAIEKWVNDAYVVHSEIETAHDQLAAFLKSIRHPKWLPSEWPGLSQFVGEFPSHMMLNAEHPARALYDVTPAIRRRIETILTKCSLLEEVTIDAWVAYASAGTDI